MTDMIEQWCMGIGSRRHLIVQAWSGPRPVRVFSEPRRASPLLLFTLDVKTCQCLLGEGYSWFDANEAGTRVALAGYLEPTLVVDRSGVVDVFRVADEEDDYCLPLSLSEAWRSARDHAEKEDDHD